MTDSFTTALKQNFPEQLQHNEQQKHLIKTFSFWTPEDWRKHYDNLKFNNFRVLPKGLLYSQLFANLKPPAQTTLLFAISELHFNHKNPDKRHNQNRPQPAQIVSNLITLPLAALQAIGVGSKNTCSKAINTLIQHNVLIKHPNNNVGKPNTFSFTQSFIINYICL